jgi:8-oxo-dGTP diphosphatase
VLYVDAGRARRAGIQFRRGRSGLWLADQVPARFVLNLQAGFRERFSAGGIIVRDSPDGPELLLISCRRASGATWEIAKGKLEPGEPPTVAACREVLEEMGIEVGLRITNTLGVARYGFRTPEGEPRLKTLFVYLMRADPCPEAFVPAGLEGIEDVRWFGLQEACRRVTHGSLRPLMATLRGGLPTGS